MKNNYLDLKSLVCAPIEAITESNNKITTDALNLISQMSYSERDETGEGSKLHLNELKLIFQRLRRGELNTNSLEKVMLKIPSLAVMPLNNIKIHEAKINFNVEVKDVDSEEQKIYARICAEDNDKIKNLPKVNFAIKLEEKEVPEGLAKVMDLLNESESIKVISSKMVDENGFDCSEDENEYYNRKLKLKKELSILENYYNSVEIMVKDLESRQMSTNKYKHYIEETERLILEKKEEILENEIWFLNKIGLLMEDN